MLVGVACAIGWEDGELDLLQSPKPIGDNTKLSEHPQSESILTKRKIHEASEMEPKTPESASCVVRCRCGLLCASMAVQNMTAGGLFRATKENYYITGGGMFSCDDKACGADFPSW